MAHNRSPSKIRSDVLAVAIEIYRGWQIEVECAGTACPVGRCHQVDALAAHYPGLTVGLIIGRFRGRGSEAAVIVDPRHPDRRVAFGGPECLY